MKVSKLDFYFRDLCIFNIVNQLMIRELHLTHRCHQTHPLSAISTTGKNGGGRAKIQNLPRCISIVGKLDKRIICLKKLGNADRARTSKIRFKSQQLYQLRQSCSYDLFA